MPIKPASWLWGHLPWKPWPRFAEAGRWVWVPETSFSEKPVALPPWKCRQTRDTDVKAASTERHSCQFSFSCLQNPSVIMTRNPHTMKSVANIFNHQGKVFVFLFKMKKDKQYHLRYEFIISSSTLVSPQRSFLLSLNLEPPKWLSQCCHLNPWTVVLREWRLSKWTSSILPKSVLSLVAWFVPIGEHIFSLPMRLWFNFFFSTQQV